MKHVFTFLLASVVLFSCSKDKDDDNKKQDRTLQVTVVDYQPPNLTNHYWAVKFHFQSPVTIKGSARVDFDVYNLNAFYKHYSEKVNFEITNGFTYLHPTQHGSALQGPEIKNIIVDSLIQTTGNYNITIK